MDVRSRRVLIGTTLSALIASASAGVAAPTATVVTRAAALGTTVTMRYAERPSRFAGSEDDSGPILASGMLEIGRNGQSTPSTFSFESLAMLRPFLPQIMPSSADRACGASGAIAIVPIGGSSVPAVVVTSVVSGKGCFPVSRVFVPRGSAYVAAPLFAVAGDQVSFRSNETARVTRVRKMTLPDPPADMVVGALRHRSIAIVDAVDRKGAPETLAFDLGKSASPVLGETIVISGKAAVAPDPELGFVRFAPRRERSARNAS